MRQPCEEFVGSKYCCIFVPPNRDEVTSLVAFSTLGYSEYRVFSSAGLEHHLDRVGVGGSNPPRLTGTKFVVLVFRTNGDYRYVAVVPVLTFRRGDIEVN